MIDKAHPKLGNRPMQTIDELCYSIGKAVDVWKIKVGDEVTVRGKVTIVHHDDPLNPIRLHGGTWIKREDILAHTPTPREFKPGDRVTWGCTGWRRYEFITQRGSAAIIWNDKYGSFSPNISELLHAE